jgi:hypothetical protein
VRSRYVLASGLALAYSLALLGDNMMYVFLPSHPGAAGIAAASLGIVLSANRFVRLAANSLGASCPTGSAVAGPISSAWCWRSPRATPERDRAPSGRGATSRFAERSGPAERLGKNWQRRDRDAERRDRVGHGIGDGGGCADEDSRRRGPTSALS